MVQFAVLTVLFVLAFGFAVTSSRVITRAGRAAEDTAARHRFLTAFDALGAGSARVPAELLVQAFETLARRMPDGTPPSALRPSARLAADLGLSVADVEDAALLVAARCEARLPQAQDLDALTRRVVTVEDLVRFLVPFVEAAGAPALYAVTHAVVHAR